MKHNKWLFRLTAISLSTALFLTSISFPAIAAETSDSSTDSIEVETTALNETNLYAEDTTAATTETENDSLSEAQPINTIESDSEQHTITGFAPLSEDECHLYMSYYDKPSEADLIAELPSALNVYLDGRQYPFPGKASVTLIRHRFSTMSLIRCGIQTVMTLQMISICLT